MVEPIVVNWRDANAPRRCRVFVDGLERKRVCRCQLGAGGWAEVIVVDGNGVPIRDRSGGAIKRQHVTGVVTLRAETSRDAFLLERLRSRSLRSK